MTVKSKPPQAQPRKRGDQQSNNDPYRRSGSSQPPVSSSQEQQRRSGQKPIHPNDNLSDLSGYQDAEEEEDIDDYFQMIENAISDKKPQVIAGARKTSDIQRQLFNKETDKEQSSKVTDYSMQKGQVTAALRQIDIYNQNQIQQTKNMPAKNYPNAYSQRSAADTVKEKNDLNIFEQDKARPSKKGDFYETNDSDYGRKDPQYIIQPPEQKTTGQPGESKQGYDKLLLHELTPDTRQPSAKHYLEEHKTQPVSYEAFSSAKAMQQMQTDPRQQQAKLAPNVAKSYQQTKDVENRNQQNYYYGQLSSSTSKSAADDNTNGEGQNQKKPKPPKPEPQDWSPVSDLSPILDVSPSIEAAEQVRISVFRILTNKESFHCFNYSFVITILTIVLFIVYMYL